VNITKKIVINHRYLNIPVKNDAPKRLMSFYIDDKLVREFLIELAEGEPDFWVFSDVSEFENQWMSISINNESNPVLLERIEQSDSIKESEDLYKEKYRPQFHFTSRRGWINDPNGLVYFKGEYHLFYQHNPYGVGWANMHWGHAVSTDLMHWKELEISLYPDEMGTMYSGSGIVDFNNSSGLGEGTNETLVVAYTAAGDRSEQSKGLPFVQCLAYSVDNGRKWIKYSGNPIINNIVEGNRDPKIIWHQLTRKWVMTLYLDKNDYAVFTSDNLKDWTKVSDLEIPGCEECPDIFELPIDDDPKNTKWVFWGGNGSYLIGSFDGQIFTPESEAFKAYEGNVSYAAQSWSDIPEEDGRRIQITWARFDLPGMPFNRFMTFPCELTLRTTDEGIRLFNRPIEEIKDLHHKTHSWENITVKQGDNPLDGISGDLFDIRAEFEGNSSAEFGFNIMGIPVSYNVGKQELSCEGIVASLKPVNGRITLHILVDRTSIEIFGNQGRVFIPVGVIPTDSSHSISVFVNSGEANLSKLEIHELKSTWT
jgi:fructan beta-fructosidase